MRETTGEGGLDRARLRAVLLSAFVCPGAGQLAGGAWLRGGLLIAATLVVCLLLILRLLRVVVIAMPLDPVSFDLLDAWRMSWEILERSRPELVPLTGLLLLLWVAGIADAWRSPRVAKGESSGDT